MAAIEEKDVEAPVIVYEKLSAFWGKTLVIKRIIMDTPEKLFFFFGLAIIFVL